MGLIISLLMGRGLSALAAKAIVYGVIAAIVGGVLLGIRHHYVSLGYQKAIAAVKKQDDRAISAANEVEKRTTVCTEKNGYWDVITQGCKLDEEPRK